MGAYCKFCQRRCFVVRTVPDGPHKGWSGCMATCPRGMEHDREMLGGYDHTNSINPADPPQPATERTRLGGLVLTARHNPTDLPAYELSVQDRAPSHGDPVAELRVRGFQVAAYVYPDDPLTDTRRVVLVDELGGHAVIVDTRVPGAMLGARLLVEGMLRGYAAANGVTAATGPDPAKDPATGDWWTCSLHGGAITQDCTCTPAQGLGNVGAAVQALNRALYDGAESVEGGHRAALVAAVEAYHGIRRCERCGQLLRASSVCSECLESDPAEA